MPIAAAHTGAPFAQWLRIGLPAVLLSVMIGVLFARAGDD